MSADEGSLAIVVLAAGKGTRMKSDLPKVMQPVLEEPMLYHVMKAVSPLGPVAVIVGHGGGVVESYLASNWPAATVLWQRDQLGTGHAVMMAKEWLSGFDRVLIVNGDMPLLKTDTVRYISDSHVGGCSFATFSAGDPTGYGRIIKEPRIHIVEEKDCSEAERAETEVNAGVYLMDVPPLLSGLDELGRDNSQGEYYLVDILDSFHRMDFPVSAVHVDSRDDVMGVNNPLELAEVGRILRDRYLNGWMIREGVKCIDPSSVWIGPEVVFKGEATIYPNVQMWGKTEIGRNVTVESFSVLRDVVVGDGSRINGYGRIEDSSLGREIKAGPFCYIRQETDVSDEAFVGKFVEVKKSFIGKGSKVPHLSYMGDATLGERVNIGAGTITCNYDGKNKHKTSIGDDVFVGSDTMLVAPVKIGDNAMTGAGSVITKDVPDGALAIGRARQRNIEDRRNLMKKKSGGGDRVEQ
ncbi:bifunctional UDP-N-acetylglucosamine diphosphorylase/glucosamine-1-phosphate N-acetyltransferase GlmU [Dethiosulfovibrio sp. F2B]|uniref:bifunctional UDP-N-acetylglucosamine diphosphorylase/glucosamine-1-phosphate N-acetyltransferase GlmU n=1 Tax=Dethiosulfovibrio faecalis TaxID=2720018 RepID=UPI001F02C032|nr:bifunctional UDP-N-acetylglucosamine diphosphorylase/glucosamine-1-phosphate N-acetyltransferase GlmU [Dethiosulfovibrio faecalis]MCF4152090.1 bifunctional UDP-N-acetylglucosamine diphosphorylase/glucosamine-1-phosphate N-acetyltransferase GlmU [Dethiosulfovibrio faecalis]